ncbi:MAG: MBL fold metallo-hydrolase, partial [Desulfobacteraceae bacterium]|nr:MBL fold metallo-hydrolase [Desulfobacteraceae bacterium]
MNITFYGAVREVTGSMHLLSTEKDKILFDCGMYQGRRKESERKNRVLPFDPRIITNIILSHAHIDHSGRIPLITKGDFHGRILSTRATEDVCEYLFKDSAKIQESDSDYLNYKSVRRFISHLKPSKGQDRMSPSEVKKIKKLLKKGRNELNKSVIKDLIKKHNLEMVTPLYTSEDAAEALGFFDARPYNKEFTIGTDMTCKFYEAGHILGSAISIVKAKENGRTYNICYSGDFGRFGKPILKDPTLDFAEEDRDIDLLIMESTYGNRFHEPVQDQTKHLAKIINETYERGGSVLIPS